MDIADPLTEPLLTEPLSHAESSSTTFCDTQTSATDGDVDVNTSMVCSSKDVVLTWPPCGDRSSSSTTSKYLLVVNHNVFYNILLSFLYGLSESLWSGTVLVAYLKKLGHDSNKPVGNVEAVNGLAALVAALPTGYLADTYRRSTVLAVGGGLFLLTTILHIALITWIGTDEESHHHDQFALDCLAVIMGLWGIAGGIVNGPAQALFADSIPQGQRSVYYSYLMASYLIASAVGPAVAIGLFQTVGDVWNMKQLRNVLYVGLFLEFANAAIMFVFDDSKALDESGAESGEDSVSDDRTELSSSLISTVTTTPSAQLGTEPLLPQSETNSQEANNGDTNSAQGRSLSKKERLVPYIMFFHSLIMAIGSGMTVKFFPLFFKDDVGMTPSQVQLIYVIVPLAMAAFSALCTRIAAMGLGRIQASMIFQLLGIALLFSLVIFQSYLDSHPAILVPVFILRSALVNAVYPVEESVMMDFVPKHERARWKSLESVASFGWCGSAALGGWIADRYDYTRTFFVTALIQLVGVLIMVVLIPIVPRIEGQSPQQTSTRRRAAPTATAMPNMTTTTTTTINANAEVESSSILVLDSIE